MKKLIGIAALLVVIAAVTAVLSYDETSGSYTFLSAYNLENLLRRVGMFGVLSIAAAFVIVTGGIDLSIGAVVCVAGCVLPWLLRDCGLPAVVALPLVLGLCAAIGLWHGHLVVGLGLQPFVVRKRRVAPVDPRNGALQRLHPVPVALHDSSICSCFVLQ